MDTLRLGLAQCNFSVGNFAGNVAIIGDIIQRAQQQSVHLLAFPELALTGYPPEDLLFKKAFIDDNIRALKKIAAHAKGITVIAGFINRKKGGIYNSAAVLSGGRVAGVYNKAILPNYGVFDEKRYFQKGDKGLIVDAGGMRAAVTVCEDIWVKNPLLAPDNGKKIALFSQMQQAVKNLEEISESQKNMIAERDLQIKELQAIVKGRLPYRIYNYLKKMGRKIKG